MILIVLLHPDTLDGGDDKSVFAQAELLAERSPDAPDALDFAAQELGDVAGGDVNPDEGKDLPFKLGHLHDPKLPEPEELPQEKSCPYLYGARQSNLGSPGDGEVAGTMILSTLVVE